MTKLTEVKQAVETGQQLAIQYRDSHGRVTERVITPIRVENYGATVLAHCGKRDELRNFTLNNMLITEMKALPITKETANLDDAIKAYGTIVLKVEDGAYTAQWQLGEATVTVTASSTDDLATAMLKLA